MIAPTVKSVDDLPSEKEELEFIKAFRELMRIKNVLITFADFSWEDLHITEQAFEDYKSKHLDQRQFQKLIDTYIFSGREPLKEDIFQSLENSPSVLKAREIGERIINKMKKFVEVFVRGMVA